MGHGTIWICTSDQMAASEHELTTQDWKRRLDQQAATSREYRHKLYEKVDLKGKEKILDVGCGTGAITYDIALQTEGEVFGLDIDSKKLVEAKKALSDIPNIALVEGDATDLPFGDETFDLVVFTLVIMYIENKQRALDEMARVTSKGGTVLATLEPDYASIISYPEDPATELFLEYLKGIGADLYTGRKLKVLFNRAGLKTEIGLDTETEFLLVNDTNKQLKEFEEYFWSIEKIMKKGGWKKEEIERYKEEKSRQIEEGLWFGFLPAFYAIGRKM